MKPAFSAQPLTIRKWFVGYPCPTGAEYLYLASDLRWYRRSAHGNLFGPISRREAANWLRRERSVGR